MGKPARQAMSYADYIGRAPVEYPPVALPVPPPASPQQEVAFLLQWPLTRQSASWWLGKLYKTCPEYIASYESDRSEAVFAVNLALRNEVRILSREPSFQKGLFLATTSQIADALYAHCLSQTGRQPGVVKQMENPPSKGEGPLQALPYATPSYPGYVDKNGQYHFTPAGQAMMGMDTKSLLIGAALGALGTWLVTKKR